MPALTQAWFNANLRPMEAEARDFYAAESLNTAVYDLRAALHISGSPVDGDVEFYRELARGAGGPILDVGCGTGRVAIELARDGHAVLGVDLSAAMLANRGATPRGTAPRSCRAA